MPPQHLIPRKIIERKTLSPTQVHMSRYVIKEIADLSLRLRIIESEICRINALLDSLIEERK